MFLKMPYVGKHHARNPGVIVGINVIGKGPHDILRDDAQCSFIPVTSDAFVPLYVEIL